MVLFNSVMNACQHLEQRVTSPPKEGWYVFGSTRAVCACVQQRTKNAAVVRVGNGAGETLSKSKSTLDLLASHEH